MSLVDYSAVKLVIERFNFEKVHKAMVATDWKWVHSNCELRVPTIAELRNKTHFLLCDAMREDDCFFTGGFQASYDSKTKQLNLKFIMSEWREKVS
jgi:hypothetical protein